MKISFTIGSFDELLSYLPSLGWAEGDLSMALSELEWDSFEGEATNLEDVTVAFIDEEYIHQLNLDYRSVDEITDVLSFEVSGESGEVYICPAYIASRLTERGVDGSKVLHEEVLRMVIHGVLHILGHEHVDPFDWDSSKEATDLEEMYRLQEDLLFQLLTGLAN